MSTIKTKVTEVSATDFINKLPDERKRSDGLVLLELFSKVTGEKPKMWGPSIVGFGSYHYKSEKSKQEADWPLAAFSPRKQSLTLYVLSGSEGEDDLLNQLGKHKRSKVCLYINKLADVDLGVLEKIIRKSFVEAKKQYSVL